MVLAHGASSAIGALSDTHPVLGLGRAASVVCVVVTPFEFF
jgi:hypothetical protein